MSHTPDSPLLRFTGATLRYGERTLWQDLDLDIHPGEFIAVVGPNGSGKTSLLHTVLGTTALSAGRITTATGSSGLRDLRVGYIPQQHDLSHLTALRGRDFVELGFDGHRAGTVFAGPGYRRARRHRIDAALATVDATDLANRCVATLSGGEQQRLRVAQALAGDPQLLLCDEPLLSLDLARQQQVAKLIDQRRKTHGTPVIFVTHEINPILPLVDRVLYIVDGRFRIGEVGEVMTTTTLSELYNAEVEVHTIRGRLIVVGTGDALDASTPASHQEVH